MAATEEVKIKLVVEGASQSASSTSLLTKELALAGVALAAVTAGFKIVTGVIKFYVKTIKSAVKGVIDFGKESLAVAIEMETAWKGVSKVYDGVATDIDTLLKPAASELTKEFGLQKLEVLGVIENFAAMGKVGTENIDLVRKSLEFATVGGLELAEATDAVTSISSIFRVEGQELTNILAALNTVENIGAVSMGELGAAIGISAGIAKDAGVDIKEFASFINVLKENGVDATEAANGLKTIFIKLRTPSKKMNDILGDIGVTVEEANGGLKDADQILKEVAGKWDDMTEAQQQAFGVASGGLFQIAKLSILMNDLTSESSRYEEVLGRVGDDTANVIAFYKELGIALDSTDVKQMRLNSIFAETQEVVGEPLREAFGQLLDIINPMAESALPVLINAMATLKLAAQGVKDFFITWWNENKAEVQPKIDDLIKQVTGEDGLIQAFKDVLFPSADAKDSLSDLVTAGVDLVYDALAGDQGLIQQLKDFFIIISSPDTIDAITGAVDTFSQALQDGTPLLSGINALLQSMVEKYQLLQRLAHPFSPVGSTSQEAVDARGIIGEQFQGAIPPKADAPGLKTPGNKYFSQSGPVINGGVNFSQQGTPMQQQNSFLNLLTNI